MSSFLNRLKNLKPGLIHSNNNESDTGSICSFDEEGFLCPVCHQKFTDTSGLERHYLQTHSQVQAATIYEDTNGSIKHSSRHTSADDPLQEAAIWKQQFCGSEESRMKLSSELMQQRQRVGDLEEEIDLLHKQLRTTQMKVIEQSQAIGNLKATKDVSDAHLAMFTDELLQTQGELKEKQNQVNTLYNDLIPRPTNDDVDVLKRELISVQQRMNDMSLEKEQENEKLRNTVLEIYEYDKRLDQFENTFNKNILNYDEVISNHTSQVQNDITQIKQAVQLTRVQKEKMIATIKSMRTSLDTNQIEINQLQQVNAQLHMDLENQNQSNQELNNALENEQKQTSSYRIQIETLTNEIQTLEQALNELRQEKNELLITKVNNDQNEDERNVVRQLIQEKEECEQQIKELRKKIKHIQEDFENISKQLTQINHDKDQLQVEKVQLNNDINSLKQQLDDLNKDKEQQINELNQELSSEREQYISINTKLENDFRQANDNHKQEMERLDNNFQENNLKSTEKINKLETEINELKESIHQQEELLNETKLHLNSVQKERDNQDKELGNSKQAIDGLELGISQLSIELDEKNKSIDRLTASIRRSIDQMNKTQQYIQHNVYTSQINILAIIEQSEQESQKIRSETLEDIHQEFTNYLSVVHTIIVDNKTKLAEQIEAQQNTEKRWNKIQTEHNQLTKEYNEEKQKFETQINELHNSLLKVSESLTEVTHAADRQLEKFENQIASLEHELTNAQSDLESRTKKYEMQFSALTENLATVRGELKAAHEKLVHFEQVKIEKADLHARLNASQDESQVLLDRSLTSENRSEKLLLENGQLAKKNSDLESALQEIAREYQSLQIYTNNISQRRWLNDHDVHECMKCNQTFSITQRKHHCRNCGNIFCDTCSSKTAIVAAASKKPQRVCDQCFKELTP
ncbi:unnamed protein product [Rotaria socialis]|uniref:Early endosome antigen 1 n=1 Tax=Rotaria socialis TaxID=392032 RepID=A0A818TD52_9BILA|nr:unnamed protein product [Rotaria socialis]CAF4846454.1 unnamed protein product [Rotaria socialis]